jgi:hypothetical protein
MKMPVAFVFVLMAGALSACGPVPVEPTYSSIQENIFTPSCASASCHGSDNPPAGLKLSADAAYDNLVDVDSTKDPDKKRVSPGDPDASMLYLAISGTTDKVGQMPVGFPLADEQIEAVKTWIENGAEKD